jgi:ADP-glucose pyrophosphorylase
MGQLSKSASSEANVAQSALFIKRVKNDLYAISDAVSRKDGSQVLKFHTEATNDLVAFIKSL